MEVVNRLYDQYSRMLLAAWLGCEFEGDALVRWNRLRALFSRGAVGRAEHFLHPDSPEFGDVSVLLEGLRPRPADKKLAGPTRNRPEGERVPVLVAESVRDRLRYLLHQPWMRGVGYSEFLDRAIKAAYEDQYALTPDELCPRCGEPLVDHPDNTAAVEGCPISESMLRGEE